MRFFNRVVLLLTIALVFFSASATLADDNAVSSAWVYDDLKTLYDAGYLTDYPQKWVASGQQLSRFEIAFYVKVFLVDNFQNSTQKIELNSLEEAAAERLVAEFQSELTAIGIKIADIREIAPGISTFNKKNDGMIDLDDLIRERKSEQGSFYYIGNYFFEMQRKSFAFVPRVFVNADDLKLLDSMIDSVIVLRSTKLDEVKSLLVLRGLLPFNENEILDGYYLFSLEDTVQGNLNFNQEREVVMNLLDEINNIQQIEYLCKISGDYNFDGYVRTDTVVSGTAWLGDINTGMKVGGLLLFSQNYGAKNVTREFGLPYADAAANSGTDGLSLGVAGVKEISPQLSVTGGIDFLYRQTDPGSTTDYSHSDTKTSAGLNYQVNRNWTLMTYQSFVDSKLGNSSLSTTSLGVNYGGWMIFWFAYQLIDFDDPFYSGTVKFRF